LIIHYDICFNSLSKTAYATYINTNILVLTLNDQTDSNYHFTVSNYVSTNFENVL